MKRQITFKGSNASGFVAYGGVKFPCGEAVMVTTGDDAGELSKSWLHRLENHPEFEVDMVKPTPKTPAPKAAAENED